MPAFESKEDYYYDALKRIEVLCQEDELGASSEKRFAIINLIHDIATTTLHDEPEIFTDEANEDTP